MVARLQLQKMCQDRDELAGTFVVRIENQASVCQFDMKCTCGVNVLNSDLMIQDTLIVGLAHNDICLKKEGSARLAESIIFLQYPPLHQSTQQAEPIDTWKETPRSPKPTS
ncbi:hypothetical protein RRG08_054347 [Elysia crispata]|uniref:Uncharacterized protein n=1 Tax=Elysia crispata TaxID=231223 RepID=A0AAE1B410_9GAST|nr:hypothetical protein RRG08_054347 [Elysia crispata]